MIVFGSVANVSTLRPLEIVGRDGMLRFSCYRFDSLEVVPAGRVPGNACARLRQAIRTLRELPGAVARAGQGGDMPLSYAGQWRHFLRAIRTGGPVECPLEDGRRALEVVQAAVQSAARGRSVRLAPTIGDARAAA